MPELGSCSAWPSRSQATSAGSASSSAMTRISVGPASRSMPHRPYSCRLASATNRLPAPQSMSTGSTTPMPKAMSASAGTPPSAKMRSAPAAWIAWIVSGYQRAPLPRCSARQGRRAGHDRRDARHLRGDDAHLRGAEHRVPAAGDVAADAPHRQVPVAEDDARPDLHLERPHRGELGLGESAHVGLAPLRVRPGLRAERRDASSMSARESSNVGGSHPSNFRLYSRTASMPRRSSARSISETVAAVSRSCSNRR